MRLRPPTPGSHILFACAFVFLILGSLSGQAEMPVRFVEGEVVVTFKPGATRQQAESALNRRSLRMQRHFSRLSSIRRRSIGVVRQSQRSTESLIQELKNDPTVESVEPNYLRWFKASPNDTRYSEQWALRNTGQTVDGTTGTSGADIRFENAWSKARPPGDEVVVGIIDSGMDRAHPDLSPRLWINPGEIPDNNLDDDGNGYVDDVNGFDFVEGISDFADADVHGTHVAGTVAAQGNNGTGVIGVNDRVRLLPMKVSADGESMSTSAIIEALEYAVALKQRGVPIVALNGSYGGGGFSNAERSAMVAAGTQGIIFCAAAGNESANNDTVIGYPANYRLSNMLVVGSSDSKDGLSDFSNYGQTTVDLVAPGTSILSTQPSSYTVNAGAGTHEALPMTFAGLTSGLSGQLVACGIGNPGEFPAAVNGNIALIQRGTLTFAEKAANAKAAGARAVVIDNNAPGLFLGTLGASDAWLPVFAISQSAGVTLRQQLPRPVSIAVTSGYQFLDGTSMATPHVTGAVAFAAINFPNDSVAQRIRRILDNVDVKPAFQNKTITGGRLNLERIVDSNRDGTGDWQALALSFASPSSLPGAVLQESYVFEFATTSGTAPFEFSLSSGTLPAGLELDPETGIVSGLPTAAGSYSFTLAVNDSAGASGSRTFYLTIAEQPVSIVSSASLPGATDGSLYVHQLTATGGTPSYTWSLVAGSSLPAGLTFSSAGLLSGYAETGSYTFSLQARDIHQLTAQQEFTLEVSPASIVIQTGAELPYGVRNEPYSVHLAADDGTESPSFTWRLISGSLPSGLGLTGGGQITGKPTTAGTYSFRIGVEDEAEGSTSRLFTLVIASRYTVPAIAAFDLPSTYIGEAYSAAAQATDYPKSFRIRGLPKGLTYSAKTGTISGRARESGSFPVTVNAINPGGAGAEVTATLVVRPLSSEWLGNFAGLVDPDASANSMLGSRLALTTTSLGSFTVKITTGATAKSAKGFLLEEGAQIDVLVNNQPLLLNVDSESGAITGTYGGASVRGWRIPWHARTLPATDLAGYYSASIKLEEPSALAAIPQGTGYVTLKVATSGVVTLAGKTAVGDGVTTSIGAGARGEAGLYQSLYKHKGSLSGTFQIQVAALDSPAANAVAGNLSWLRPQDGSRTYGTGFGSLSMTLQGGYLAPKPAGGLVRGLPATDTPFALAFFDGGLADSDTDPDMSGVTLNSSYVAQLPKAGTAENPARVTLRVNKASGAVTGSFVLAEDGVKATRKASFLGYIIPDGSGGTKAEGYFLLPQIPEEGQKATSAPILSGSMKLVQPDPEP